MINVDTEIEPPGLEPDDDDDDRPSISLHASVLENDGTGRNAYTHITGDDISDDRIADALIACLRGVATMRGPGLVAAVEKRLR